MRHYRRMSGILLAVSTSLVIIVLAVILYSDAYSTRLEYDMNQDILVNELFEFTGGKISALQEYMSLLRTYEYTDKFASDASPTAYNKLNFYRFVRASYSTLAVRDATIALTTLKTNYVATDHGTSGIVYFLKDFRLSESDLEYVKSAVESGSINNTLFLTIEGQPALYCFVRAELFGRGNVLYLFAEYGQDRLFNMKRLTDGTLAIIYKSEVAAAAGKLTADEVSAYLNSGKSSMMVYTNAVGAMGYELVYLSDKPGMFSLPLWVIILIAIATLVSVSTIMLLISRRIWLPMRDLLTVAGADGHTEDEFAYLSKTITTLHSGITATEQDKQDMVESIYYRSLLENHPVESFIAEQVQEPSGGRFILVLFKYNAYKSSSELPYDENITLVDILRETMESAEFSKLIDVSFNTKALLITCNDTSAFAEELNSLLIETRDNYGSDFVAAVSTPFDKPEHTHVAYNYTRWVIEQGGFQDDTVKVTVSDIKPVKNERVVFFTLTIERKLSEYVLNDKLEQAYELLDEVFAANITQGYHTLPELTTYLSTFLSRLYMALPPDAERVLSDADWSQRLSRCRSYTELKAETRAILYEIEQKAIQPLKQSRGSVADKITTFISENYSKDIGLSDLANLLGLSDSYVSSLFKDLLGQNFKDYLGEVRFHKACELIRSDSRIRVKQIAEQVGCSTDILSRLFVRHTGVPPSEYQRGYWSGIEGNTNSR